MTSHLGRLGLCLALAGTAACKMASGPIGSSVSHPVDFRIVAASALKGAPTGGPLQISSVRLAVGAAALGNGDQFGCQDCQDNGNNESDPGVQLVEVPADGSPVLLATEQVTAGRYSAAEIELNGPVEVVGTFNKTPFTVSMPLHGSFREPLNPPVDVGTSTPAALGVTITLPLSSWFGPSDATLDPNDPAQLAQIEKNAQAALGPLEAGAGETETGGSDARASNQ